MVVQTTMDGMSEISAKDINDTRNLQTKASFSFEVIHASMPPENLFAIGHAVVWYARAAHAYSAGIECPYCILDIVHETIKGYAIYCPDCGCDMNENYP